MARSLFAILHSRYGPKNDGVTRRRFLQAGLLVSAGLMLSSTRTLRAEASGKSIIVVGAGLAGLSCAYELTCAGYNVTVIEARKRIGGRVITFRDFARDKSVEGGGEFIGHNHPLWQAYAKKFDFTMNEIPDVEGAEAPVMIGGKLLSDEEAGALHKEMDEATALMSDDAKDVVEDEPWKTPNAQKLDRRTVADWIDKLDASANCKTALTLMLTADNGVSLDKCSYLGMLTQIKGGGLDRYWTESETNRLRGGNQKLAEKLASIIGPDRIVTGTTVEAIDLSASGASVTTQGRRFDADDVVLAVPPTVWNKIRITPALPRELTPQMGRSVKYLAQVGDRFWKDAKQTPDALNEGALTETWDATTGQDDPGAFVLTGFCSAGQAEACRKGWVAKKDAFFLADLEKVYKDFGKAFKESRFMDWPSDPQTMGGFSFAAPGQVTKVGPLLAKTHADHLHHAGEHTCYKFVGYMEGALQSGVRVARKLAERDGVVIKGPTTEPATEAEPQAAVEPGK